LFLKGPYSNVRPFFCSKSKPPPSTDGGGFFVLRGFQTWNFTDLDILSIALTLVRG
jgi:hypothetical protein